MPICSKCGESVADNATICLTCGTKVADGVAISDQERRLFVDSNFDYYESEWRKMAEAQRAYSWNWPAAILTIGWLLYRKMYVYAALAWLLVAAQILLQFTYFAGEESKAFRITDLIGYGIAIGLGLFANSMYRRFVDAKIRAIRLAAPLQDADYFRHRVASSGGVSLLSGLGLSGLAFAATVGLVLLLVYPKLQQEQEEAPASQASALDVMTECLQSVDPKIIVENCSWMLDQKTSPYVRASVFLARAAAYKQLLKSDEELKDLSSALELDTRNATAYAQRGDVSAQHGAIERALSDYTSSLYSDSNAAAVYLRRGLSRAILGLFTEALQDFQEALKLDPNLTQAQVAQGAAQRAIAKKTKSLTPSVLACLASASASMMLLSLILPPIGKGDANAEFRVGADGMASDVRVSGSSPAHEDAIRRLVGASRIQTGCKPFFAAQRFNFD